MYRELTADQMQDVSSVLGVPLEAIGEWSLTPDNGPVKYAIRSTGDIVIRLTCTDKRGHRQQPRIANFTEDSGHYLFCSLNERRYKNKKVIMPFIDMFVAASLFCIVVETCQLLSRVGVFDVDDIILNITGAILGFCV